MLLPQDREVKADTGIGLENCGGGQLPLNARGIALHIVSLSAGSHQVPRDARHWAMSGEYTGNKM